jgi:hypothetical protein
MFGRGRFDRCVFVDDRHAAAAAASEVWAGAYSDLSFAPTWCRP